MEGAGAVCQRYGYVVQFCQRFFVIGGGQGRDRSVLAGQVAVGSARAAAGKGSPPIANFDSPTAMW